MGVQTKYNGNTVGYKMKSGETLTALRFVTLSSGTLAAIAATTTIPLGVLLEKTDRTDVKVLVQIDGIVDVEVGTTGVTEMGIVKTDNAGCVVDASTLAAGEVAVGVALETKTDGQYAKVALYGAAILLA